MKIIGLDPGLRYCGFGIIDVEGNQMKLVTHNIIKVPTNITIEKRLAVLFTELKSIFEIYKPQEASLEQIFFNSNAQTSMLLGMARGVIALIPGIFNIPLYEYAPKTIKQATVGFGNADKEQIKKMVCIILNYRNPITADEADALAAAICHAHHSKFGSLIARTGEK